MTPCDACQGQLLDHLYGLLDDAQGEALLAHLSGCAACREALAAAEAQRSQLAAAAKTSFPAVRFEPPAQSSLALAPLVQPPRPARRSWRRWAAAAAVLLALGGLGTVFGSWYHDHTELLQARDSLKEEVTTLTAAEASNRRAAEEMREIQNEILRVEQEWKAELNQTEQKATQGQLKMTVVGPRTVEAGARNEYRIETRRPAPAPPAGFAPSPANAGTPVPAKVVAKVVDPRTRKVYYEKTIASSGNCLFTLPPDLPIKPNTQLALEVTARADTGAEAKVTERLPLLGTLYLTHLAIDRPTYRPGEVVHFRSLTLERFRLRPAQEDLALIYRITDPSGAEIFTLAGRALLTPGPNQPTLRGPDGKELCGIGVGEFVISPTAPGGEYTLTVSEAQGRFPPEQRKFFVNRYQTPRLNKEVDFNRKSYGPGDEVAVSCKVSRVENKDKPLAHQPVLATVTVDGKPLEVENAKDLRTDEKGNVPPIRFRLPKQMERGQGTLAVQFTEGANQETVVRPIPIVLKKLFVDFYPEGGDLVAGVPNRVYFQARTTRNKPAELRGRIVDGTGKVVAVVQTLHDDKEPGANQGMGLFQLTPQAGQSYELKIDVPLGIEGRYPLPAVRPDGVVLAIPGGVFTKQIDAILYTGRTQRRLVVGAYCRGRVLEHTKVTVKPGQAAHVRLNPAAEVGGVYRVTVFEEGGGAQPQLTPVAERLIYRRPTRQLKLAVHTDKKSYAPGDRVSITFTARDETEKKVPAVALVGVVDQSIIKLADDKTARAMPTHFLLTTEVKKPEDLEYADFLLSDHPKAAQALDLLLGTQGWRRFAEQNPAQFRQKQKEDAERLLLVSGQSAPAAHDSVQAMLARVDAKYVPIYRQKQAELAKKEADMDRRQAAAAPAAAALQTARQRLHAIEERLQEHTQQLLRAGLLGLMGLLIVIALVGFVLSLFRAVRGKRRAVPYLLAGLCALLLLGLGGAAGLFFRLNQREGDQGPELAAIKEQESRPALQARRGGHGADLPRLMPKEAPADAAPGKIMKTTKGWQGPNALPAPALQPALENEAAEKKEDKDLARPLAKGEGRFDGPAGIEAAQTAQAPLPQPLGLYQAPQAALPFAGGPPAGAMPPQAERELRKRGQYGLIAQIRMNRQLPAASALPPLVVREYAHKHQRASDGLGRDYAETVYWQPALLLPDGEAKVAFDLPDSITRFQVLVWAHTADGRLGAVTDEFASRSPGGGAGRGSAAPLHRTRP
jgi:uncharacterized membrane protein YqjE